MAEIPSDQSNPENDKPVLPNGLKATSFITNPTALAWATWIGLLLAIFSIIYTYILQKEPQPAYAIMSDGLLTNNPLESKIKVSYDSIEVKNIRILNVVIWNNGKAYLPKELISEENPISIKSSKPVGILDVSVSKTTRPDLKFTTTSHVDNVAGTPTDTTASVYDYVGVDIIGDEGLEAGDGAKFTILYTSTSNCEWYVDGRIKGIPGGIIKGNRNKTPEEQFPTYLIASFLCVFVVMLGVIYKGPDKRNKILIITLAALIIVGWLTLRETLYVITPSPPPFLSE